MSTLTCKLPTTAPAHEASRYNCREALLYLIVFCDVERNAKNQVGDFGQLSMSTETGVKEGRESEASRMTSHAFPHGCRKLLSLLSCLSISGSLPTFPFLLVPSLDPGWKRSGGRGGDPCYTRFREGSSPKAALWLVFSLPPPPLFL